MAKETAARKKVSSSFFKCKQCLGYLPIKEKRSHRCEVPSEKSVLADLEEEPTEAWVKLREFAASLGTQKIYCSAKAIMFSRAVCYMFVRSKKKKMEICVMLPRKISHVQIKKVEAYSKTRFRHTLLVFHEDSIEEPLTHWIREAWNAASKPSRRFK